MDDRKREMVNLQVRMPRELCDRIDEFRKNHQMRPSRSQTLRWLLEQGINSLEGKSGTRRLTL
jgi:metal-responsive CopG/Arc/MetJ family transcriptional regulator